MPKVTSNTLVKNGTPFIGLVIEKVLPYMEKCVVTVSEHSNDGTKQILKDLKTKYPDKIDLAYENVLFVGDLTKERDKMIKRSNTDWILFLDDDDYWPTESLDEMFKYIERFGDIVDGFAVNPYQVVDQYSHDGSWFLKWFTKWFKNKDINYRKDWPRDLVYTGDKPLYWRQNADVFRVRPRFFHLANVKAHSFREEPWAHEFANGSNDPPNKIGFTTWEQKEIEKIFKYAIANNNNT